jgi:formylglycine-generating enzyme required for sulfatase activity
VLTAYLRDRAGLLIDRGGGVYSFPHRTFQEFLAACYAADRNRNEEMATAARQDPSRWREVLLLSVGHANVYRGAVWDFVPFLCWEEAEVMADGRLSEAELWGAQLAGLALLEVDTDPAQVGRRDRSALLRVRERLTEALGDERLPAIERAQAAASLGYLGDTRQGVLDVDAMPFCYVPPGVFRMGADEVPQHENPIAQDAFDSVKPAHEVDIPYGYWLGQYPVTNAQFQICVEAGGYGEEAYWAEAIEHGFWQAGQVRGYTWIPAKSEGEWLTRDQPYDYGRPFNLPNHPVVGVNWYEALAFTRWLTERWQAAGVLPDGWQVVLPGEAEWEKGARGGFALPESPLVTALPGLAALEPTVRLVDRPQAAEPTWGPETANYRETKIKATSGIGCFRQGQSPNGCQDMLGNVWEWTRSLYGRYDVEQSKGTDQLVFDPQYRYPYQADEGRERLDRGVEWTRVLRGSSYAEDEDWLRCAFRNWHSPHSGFGYYGFRVCVSPFPYATSGL